MSRGPRAPSWPPGQPAPSAAASPLPPGSPGLGVTLTLPTLLLLTNLSFPETPQCTLGSDSPFLPGFLNAPREKGLLGAPPVAGHWPAGKAGTTRWVDLLCSALRLGHHPLPCARSEMKRWMTSLAPNRRTKFVSFTSRLPDCPQAQCMHQYVAQQPDELTLELADILNILEKTEDGWIFGERLHDQERGWFPRSMTEEILNPKIRSQNLKECIRVHKMDDPQRSQNKDLRKLGSRNRQ
ncbi:ephexin-1-like [Callospermophilus lateralis]|uniref:ephexin-1-like n=1 Tax=Callospermophilus lateralis TaxID=76772 RepID=UPI004038B19C